MDETIAPEIKLSFVRLKIPRLIPKEIIEAVKGKIFSADTFYQFQESQLDNPLNLLYAVIDDEKKIHGFLWAEIDPLDRSMVVRIFSMSKEVWERGNSIKSACDFLETIRNKINFGKIVWICTNEKFFLKHGFKRSKNVLMEYNKENQE